MGYELKVAFLVAEGDETLPVVDHFFTADGALGLAEELGGGDGGKGRDFILWEELTGITYEHGQTIP